MPIGQTKRTILLADDNLDDADLFRRAVRAGGFENPFHAVHSAAAAINYLRGEGQYADRSKFPLPHLLLLDPNLPGQSGWEVLRWVRERPELGALVVIMLGGDGSPADKEMARRLGANACHPKPSTTEDLERLVKRLCEFWLLGGSARGGPSVNDE